MSGVTANWPLGLRCAEAKLGKELVMAAEMPADAVSPVARLQDAGADLFGGQPRRRKATPVLGDIEIRLIKQESG